MAALTLSSIFSPSTSIAVASQPPKILPCCCTKNYFQAPSSSSQRKFGHALESENLKGRNAGSPRALAEPSIATTHLEDDEELLTSGMQNSRTLDELDASRDESGRVLEVEEEEEDNMMEAGLSEEEGDNGAISPAALQREVTKRRNFAIISHPDAGKTTLVFSFLITSTFLLIRQIDLENCFCAYSRCCVSHFCVVG